MTPVFFFALQSKQIDSTLADKFAECHEIFSKFEAKGESLNPALNHVMGIVFGRLFEAQRAMSEEVNDFVRNLERNVINPLSQYQVSSRSVFLASTNSS